MKKFFTQLLAMVLCFAASTTASAQFSATIEAFPEGYVVKEVTFSLNDISKNLNTDAATLSTALMAWINGEDTETNYFYLANLDDEEERYNYTQGDKGGYWMTKDAKPTAWTGEVGDDAWYNIFSVNDSELILGIGQHPDAFEAGEEVSAQFILAFNGAQVTFDITLKVISKEDMGIPEAVTKISQLKIAGEKVVEIHQYARTGYDSDEVVVNIADAIEAIGANAAAVEQEIAQVLYSSAIGAANEDGETSITDELTNASTAGTHGWWFVRVYAMSDVEIDGAFPMIDKPQSGAGAYANGSFFAERFTFDAESGDLTCYVGQMPSMFEGGEEMYADLYLVWGGNAYRLTYKLIIDEREALPFDEMEEVGTLNFTVEQYPTTDYSTTSITIDLDAIAAELDAEASTLLLWAATENGVTDAPSANNGGYWFNMDGYKGSWGSSASIFVEPANANDFSTLNVGQYPSSLTVGDAITVKLYLIGNNKYYTILVTMNVIEKPAPAVEFYSVAERVVEIQAVPTNAYEIDMTFDINTDEFMDLIGTTSPTFLAQEAPEEGEEWAGKYSDAYSCDPKPGFWMSADGYASTWGANSPFGVCYQASEKNFIFWQYPNANQIGDERKAVFYLANLTTGAMITYNVTIKFVSEVIDTSAEVVGQEDIYLPVDGTEVVVDLSKAIEALEIDDVTMLTSVSNQFYEALLSNATFSNPMPLDDVYFKADGGMCSESEVNDAFLILAFLESDEENSIAYSVELWGDFADDQQLKTKVAFNVEGKRYIFNITFVSGSFYTGVNTVKAAAADAPVFDLAGRRVSKVAQRGIYIQNGKKVAVK